jgi:CIC family chloride channel protein
MHARDMPEGLMQRKREALTEDEGDPRGLFRLLLVAALAGVLIGLVGSAFRLILQQALTLSNSLLAFAHSVGDGGILIPMLAVALCAAAARALVRLAPEAAGSGVPQIEAMMREESAPPRLKALLVKFIGGSLALGSGLALGREGPTIQMGAAIGASLAQWTRMAARDVRNMTAALAGAGLAVAFGAPLAGVLFTFEEISRRFELRLMVASLLACAVAWQTSLLILGDGPIFKVPAIPSLNWTALVPAVLFGCLLGALGVVYNRLVIALLEGAERFQRVPDEVKAGLIGAMIGLIMWFEPGWVGGGEQLTQQLLDNPTGLLLPLLLILGIRLLIGPLSYAAGTPGGLFAPALLIGALCGILFAGMSNEMLGMHLDPAAFALLGMSAFFAAVVRAPLTGIAVIIEMTAISSLIMPMLLTTAMAVAVASAMRNPPIYDTLRQRMLGK